MKNIFQIFMCGVLPWIARLHYKNWFKGRWFYPQLWYVTKNWFPKYNRKLKVEGIYKENSSLKFVQKTCKVVTGHEISKTEIGFASGSKHVDCQCRWCDELIQIHKDEIDLPPHIQDIIDEG